MTRNKQWDEILIKIKSCLKDIDLIINSSNNIPMIEIDIALEKLSIIYDKLLSLKLQSATNEENGFFSKNSTLINKIIRDSVIESKNSIIDKEKNQMQQLKEEPIKADNRSQNEQITSDTKTKQIPEDKKESHKEEITQTIKEHEHKIIVDNLKKEQRTIGELLAEMHQKKDIATLQQLKPIKDLKKAISINDKIMFIKEIFNNNVDKYNETIEKLNNSNNLDEALEYLDKVVSINNENQVLQQLLELVYRRYME